RLLQKFPRVEQNINGACGLLVGPFRLGLTRIPSYLDHGHTASDQMEFPGRRVSSPWNSGCARAINALARSADDLPLRSVQPNSVTTTCVSVRGVVTGPSSRATMRD